MKNTTALSVMALLLASCISSEKTIQIKAGGMFIKKLLKEKHPIVALNVTKSFLAIKNIKATTPTGLEYFSILPFQHGKDRKRQS